MAGCAASTEATPIPIIALDSTDSSEMRNVQASAQVVPAQEARLSFAISGPIKEITVEEGTIVEAGQIVATLSSPDLEYGVLQAEDAVRKAEFDYEYWKLPRRVGLKVVERGPVAAQELEVTRKTLDTAHAELSQTELLAPFAATVISVEAHPGEYVRSGQVVIVLAMLDNLQIETIDLSELNVATVETGQPATVYVEALDKEFPGQVSAIAPISDTVGGDVVYKVTISLNEQPTDLLWGMSAEVEIQTEQ
jgi:RND family efflux transporter MFP subunit